VALELPAIETVMVLSYLVSVLAWSWHFDGAGPVGVHIAEAIGEVLKCLPRNVLGLVEAHIVMNWGDTSLSGLLWNQIEVELISSIVVLDELGVNNTSWLRILSFSISTCNKHSLVDSFVHNDQSDWRWSTDLVVERFESFFELANFLLNNLVSHLSTDTIPVDNNLGWLLSIVVVGELFDSLDQATIKILLD